jgi:hypothetical protein
MNILIGYGYHPWATATYLQRSLERRGTTTFVGTPWRACPGFTATGDLRRIIDDLPHRPDLFLYVDSGEPRYFPRGLTTLECPTACYLVDVHLRPRELLKQAMFFDYAFTAQRDFVPVLRHGGHPQASWLPLACDPEIHRRHDLPKRYDIGFVGSVRAGYERRRVLWERLARRFSVNEQGHTYTPAEMARLYSECRLVFNCSLHREVNMRVFEGPATGTLLLTDRIGNGLCDLIVDRQHVVMYDDDELVDLAEHYLRDDAARERIARQGYEHVRNHHTYDRRVDAILDAVFAPTGGPHLAAPLRRRSDAEVDLAYAELFALMGRIDDTFEQYVRVPRGWRYRLPAVKQIALCLVRRAHYLVTI